MAQNVIINGVTYSNVPQVDIPKADSGTASFYDTSDATLDSSGKMLSGNTAYANGVKYTGSIATKTGTDITASGDTVTVPAGYYASQNTKSVASGSATGPATVSGSSASVSTGTNTLTLSKTVSITPVVNAGYVSAGTAANASVSLTASVTTKGAATYTPTTSDQTIAIGRYITGEQTVKGVLLTNLSSDNIKKDVVVKVGDSTDDDCVTSVTGTYEGGGGGGGYEDITEEYIVGTDYPDGHIYAYLNRATGEVIIGGQLFGGPSLMINGGLPVENCFGTCTITQGYYYNIYSDMTISNGVLTMPSLTDMDDRVLFVILQAQGGGSIY